MSATATTPMTSSAAGSEQSWAEANQAYLVAEFARLRRQVDGGSQGSQIENSESSFAIEPAPAIDRLAEIFGLTAFERDLLLLCAGVEMDSALAAQCAEAHGGQHRCALTFGLALASLAEPHWSALTPSGPLRRFRLIHLDATHGLTAAPIRIEERVLHFLAGINQLDSRLASILTLAKMPDAAAQAHQLLAVRLVPMFAATAAQSQVLHLSGDDPDGQQDVATLAAYVARRPLYILRAEDIPADASALDLLIDLWTREVALLSAVLLIEAGTAEFTAFAKRFLDRVPGDIFLASRDPLLLNRSAARYEVNKPRPAEQKRLWQESIGPEAESLDGLLDRLAGQFCLSARTIQATGAKVREHAPYELWNACRSLSRPRLEDMAQRIVPTAEWSDLILPEPQILALRQLTAQVRCRVKVNETWGFAAKGRRGLGASALFAGESGTGKTLAAEVLAHDLGLDLYRIDLSAVVSKYIGETEKNLRQVFDAAEEGGVLLLFDEADALFGKRSDVKDSRDRYANMEVGYLLQRMEAYQGLAILTTNLKSSLDRAFQRRLRFVIEFPFPDVTQREAIWRCVFPAETPTQGIDAAALAQLKLPGGSIRNIAFNAAFLAADANEPVGMAHLLQAARLEAQKTDRPLSEVEVRGWK
ncbi:ATP-binding protein [Terracidiphilus sp.]|uniref:ATP-binding protein n=1 Tax=Terracidiphilus sp. TaxID=1964191 RepID=UPI003C1C1DB9